MPSSVTQSSIELENAECDQTSECSCQDVARVQHSNSRGDFRSRVEVGKDEDGTRVVLDIGRDGGISLQTADAAVSVSQPTGASTTPRKKRVSRRPVKLRENAVQTEMTTEGDTATSA